MRAIALAASALLLAHGAWAQDAVRGKRLYHDIGRITGAGVSCVDCHGGAPGALHGIDRAASNPGHIAYALGAIPQMTPLRGRVGPEEMAALAAYLATPNVPSPEPLLSTSGMAASPYGPERLVFEVGEAVPESSPSTVRLANRGALPFTLLAAPTLGGPDADQFKIVATDCRAGATLARGQSCAVEIVFRPRPRPDLHSAVVVFAYDWIGDGARVALIGRVR